MQNLYSAAYAGLMQTDVEKKLQAATALYAAWQAGELIREPTLDAVQTVAIPGRPAKPELVHHRQVKQRNIGTDAGKKALLHAVAHIEFNAINLALDAVYRFRDMPHAYYGDWLKVAAEEAYHFDLVRQRLAAFDCHYGDLPAHNGLWEHALKTDYDIMVRMVLVPRVLEARGLDVTPPMMQRLTEVGDLQTVAVLDIILRDEIGHVRIGSHWFRYLCEQRGLEPETTFRRLLVEVLQSPVRSPFYTEGRLQAGFTAFELEQLLELERKWVQDISL